MSNFSTTMRKWQRMCNYYDEKYQEECCNKCPLNACSCGAVYELDENTDFTKIEQIIEKWAHEHPVKYITWTQFMRLYGAATTNVLEILDDSIPEDIAIPLGFKPIKD